MMSLNCSGMTRFGSLLRSVQPSGRRQNEGMQKPGMMASFKRDSVAGGDVVVLGNKRLGRPQ